MAEQLNPEKDTLLFEPGFHAWLLENPEELKIYVATYNKNVSNAFYKRRQVQDRFLDAASKNSTLTTKLPPQKPYPSYQNPIGFRGGRLRHRNRSRRVRKGSRSRRTRKA